MSSDPLGEPCGDFVFGHHRPILEPVGIDQMDRVAVAAEGVRPRRHIVGEDPVAAFAKTLAAGVLDHIVGLRRKADDEGRPIVAALSDAGEDVRVFGKAERRWRPCILLQLVPGGGFDP